MSKAAVVAVVLLGCSLDGSAPGVIAALAVIAVALTVAAVMIEAKR